MWAGVAGAVVNNNTGFEIAISVHDSVYNTDFASSIIPYDAKDPEEQAAAIEKHTVEVLRKFSSEHMCKFLGAGVTVSLLREVRSFESSRVPPSKKTFLSHNRCPTLSRTDRLCGTRLHCALRPLLRSANRKGLS